MDFGLWHAVWMQDQDLYRRILEIEKPWEVTDVLLNRQEGEVCVEVEWAASEPLLCPECGGECPGYDTRERRWRHLDTCQYRTILKGRIPRVKCREHGVRQVRVPWAESGSHFTALFERLVIDWLHEASIKGVSEQMRLTWDEVDGIMQRAVHRGLRRREEQKPTRIGIDETSFQKRHEYVTVINDLDNGTVVDVLNDRKQETLEKGLQSLSTGVLKELACVAMDMWAPYILAVKEQVPNAEEKIAYDKFHVIKHLSDAVDKVRRNEHRALVEEGIEALKGSKYLWLRGKENLRRDQKRMIEQLSSAAAKTARAWSIKEFARQLWHYVSKTWALKAWRKWYMRAIHSRLKPMKEVARMIWKHITGIINGIVAGATNARAEAVNGRIQSLKKTACGFRNRERFRAAIFFHLGGLDLYPEPIL